MCEHIWVHKPEPVPPGIFGHVRHGADKTLQNLSLDKSDHIWLEQAWPHLRAHKLAKARVWRSINRSWSLYVLAHLILAKLGCSIFKIDVAMSINNITNKNNNDEQDNDTSDSVVSIKNNNNDEQDNDTKVCVVPFKSLFWRRANLSCPDKLQTSASECLLYWTEKSKQGRVSS